MKFREGGIRRFGIEYHPAVPRDFYRSSPQAANAFTDTQMVKQNFSNLEIDFWVHSRKLGTSQPSLCLFHDSIQIGSPILDALNELKDDC